MCVMHLIFSKYYLHVHVCLLIIAINFRYEPVCLCAQQQICTRSGCGVAYTCGVMLNRAEQNENKREKKYTRRHLYSKFNQSRQSSNGWDWIQDCRFAFAV